MNPTPPEPDAFRALAEAHLDGLTLWRAEADDLRCLYANPAARQRLGLMDPLDETPLSRLRLGAAALRWTDAARRVREGAGPVQLVDQIVPGDPGSWAACSIYAVGDHVAITFQMVSALAWVDASVTSSEQRYRSVVGPQNPVCRFDPELKLTYVNDVYCRLAGMSADELIGRSILSLVSDRWVPETGSVLLETLEGKRITATTVEARLAGGATGWFQFVNYPICDAEGRLVEVEAVGSDVTELKRAEQRQRELEARLQRKERLEALEGLVGGIADDVRDLLSSERADRGARADAAPPIASSRAAPAAADLGEPRRPSGPAPTDAARSERGPRAQEARRDRVASVLIADGQPIVSEALSHLIGAQQDLRVCGPPVGSRRSALRAVDELRPDLVIADLQLADGGGLELVRQLASRGPDTKILVLSALDEVHHAQRALRAGASGYIMKHEGFGRLLHAIRTVLSGEVYLSDVMVGRVLRGLSGPETDGSPVELLSDRELDVLQLLGEGLKPREIAERLFVSQRTVESHRDHIRKKLDLESSADVLRFAIEWVRQTQEAAGS